MKIQNTHEVIANEIEKIKASSDFIDSSPYPKELDHVREMVLNSVTAGVDEILEERHTRKCVARTIAEEDE